MGALAALFAALMLAFPLFALVFRREYSETFASPFTVLLATALAAGVVGYELVARSLHASLAKRYGASPTPLRYWNALVETSTPSLLLIIAARELDPALVLQGPGILLYGVFIVLSTLRLDPRLSLFTGLVAAVEFGAISVGYGFGAGFSLIKALVLLLSGAAAAFVAAQIRSRIAKMFEALEERQRVVSAFGQQVSPAVVDELMKRGGDLASRRSFVCVMFMDIRDFTPMVESRSPEEIVALQNEVFGVAIEVVSRHHGTINQLLGDGFMATFGAPLSTGDDCRNAVAAARELVSRIKQVRIGVGLHAGDAVTGNVGSALRKQYSVTGNVVILAQRIEQLNKQFGSQLLVSREVLRHAGAEANGAMALGPVHVKGRADPIEVYRVA
jgi:adenylate cyclase